MATTPVSTLFAPPTRKAGLERLSAFLPHAGRAYAKDRNSDLGPQHRSNTSMLSPWLRHRLITEEEVITSVLAQHGLAAGEKFVEEVFWRTWWKGHLETRPHIFTRFEEDVVALQAGLASQPELRERLAAAQEGRTGIACFDAWMKELQETGWLHNHARMWSASIWTFTLNLPWQLGAQFFLQHLVDADPASNTLSWRWVAGLHTVGKNYIAQAANIQLHTNGRFDPKGQLDESATPIPDDGVRGDPIPLPPAGEPSQPRVALLLTMEDLHAESWVVHSHVVGVAALQVRTASRPKGPAAVFTAGALKDGLKRGAAHYAVRSSGVLDEEDVAAWAAKLGVTEVVTAHTPVGPAAHALTRLAAAGVEVVQLRRRWDARVWPMSTQSFFRFKDSIPNLVSHIMPAEYG